MAFEYSNPKDLIRNAASTGAYYDIEVLPVDTGIAVTHDLQDLLNSILEAAGVYVTIGFLHPLLFAQDPDYDLGAIHVSATIHKKVMADWLETQQGVR